MRRIGPFSVQGAILIGVVIVALIGGVRCSRPENADLERFERMGYRAAMGSLKRRAVTDSVIRKVDSVTRIMTNRIASNRKVEARLLERLAANDSLLSAYALPTCADSSASTLPDSSRNQKECRERDLFVALQRTTEVARIYQDSTQALVSTVLFSIAAQAEERQAWLAEREHNTIQVAVQDSLISALRESKQCRILFVPCPNRVQSVGIGALGMLLLLL